MGNSDFDLDLRDGIAGEQMVSELFGGGVTIEVKRDFKVSESGNIAVEVSCRGQPSGLSVTKADWWAFILDGPKYNGHIVIFVRIDWLRAMCSYQQRQRPLVPGGDDGAARMVLVPVTRLVGWCPYAVGPELARAK